MKRRARPAQVLASYVGMTASFSTVSQRTVLLLRYMSKCRKFDRVAHRFPASTPVVSDGGKGRFTVDGRGRYDHHANFIFRDEDRQMLVQSEMKRQNGMVNEKPYS